MRAATRETASKSQRPRSQNILVFSNASARILMGQMADVSRLFLWFRTPHPFQLSLSYVTPASPYPSPLTPHPSPDPSLRIPSHCSSPPLSCWPCVRRTSPFGGREREPPDNIFCTDSGGQGSGPPVAVLIPAAPEPSPRFSPFDCGVTNCHNSNLFMCTRSPFAIHLLLPTLSVTSHNPPLLWSKQTFTNQFVFFFFLLSPPPSLLLPSSFCPSPTN